MWKITLRLYWEDCKVWSMRKRNRRTASTGRFLKPIQKYLFVSFFAHFQQFHMLVSIRILLFIVTWPCINFDNKCSFLLSHENSLVEELQIQDKKRQREKKDKILESLLPSPRLLLLSSSLDFLELLPDDDSILALICECKAFCKSPSHSSSWKEKNCGDFPWLASERPDSQMREGLEKWRKKAAPSPNGNKANGEKRSVTFVELYCCLYGMLLVTSIGSKIKCRNWKSCVWSELVGWLVPKRSIFKSTSCARPLKQKRFIHLSRSTINCRLSEIIFLWSRNQIFVAISLEDSCHNQPLIGCLSHSVGHYQLSHCAKI